MPNEPSLAQVIPMKDYRDAREQAVIPPLTEDSIRQAKADCERERDRAGLCTACGVMVAHHFNYQNQAIGCEAALKRYREGPRNPERWNDATPLVTLAVRKAMVDGTCGPHVEIQMAGYTNDEQLTIAATLSRVAISAYIKGLAK